MSFLIMTQMRFERTTFRLGGGCSIQLSYWVLITNLIFESHFLSTRLERTTSVQVNQNHNKPNASLNLQNHLPERQLCLRLLNNDKDKS